MLKMGSVADTVRVPPAGRAAATAASAARVPSREVFATPADPETISPRITSAPKIATTFSEVRFKFIIPPTVQRSAAPLQSAAAYHLA